MHSKRRSEGPREELELRVKAQSGRGHALYQMGNYADSIRSYHSAISMNPEGVGGSFSTTWGLHTHHWSSFQMQ